MSNTESSLVSNEVQYKKCCTCKEVKQLLFFSKNKKERDGMQSECKSCQKVRRDARIAINPDYFKDAVKKHIETKGPLVIDKEKRREYRKEWYKNNIDRVREYRIDYRNNNIDKCKKQSRLYYEANKEKCNEASRRYKEANKERLLEYRRIHYQETIDIQRKRGKDYRLNNKYKYKERNAIYYQQNKEYYRTACHKRRARLMNAEGSHTKEDIQFILEKQKGKCVTCAVCITTDYSVDHITPLSKGGSNNKDNIQLLCKSCNSSKGNKDPIDFMQTLGYLC